MLMYFLSSAPLRTSRPHSWYRGGGWAPAGLAQGFGIHFIYSRLVWRLSSGWEIQTHTSNENWLSLAQDQERDLVERKKIKPPLTNSRQTSQGKEKEKKAFLLLLLLPLYQTRGGFQTPPLPVWHQWGPINEQVLQFPWMITVPPSLSQQHQGAGHPP